MKEKRRSIIQIPTAAAIITKTENKCHIRMSKVVKIANHDQVHHHSQSANWDVLNLMVYTFARNLRSVQWMIVNRMCSKRISAEIVSNRDTLPKIVQANSVANNVTCLTETCCTLKRKLDTTGKHQKIKCVSKMLPQKFYILKWGLAVPTTRRRND